MIKSATISNCGTHRFTLERIWDRSKSFVLFIMHNPSTADHNNDDPTIRRCIEFAKSWGYGGLMVGNLFSYRATNPKDLKGKTQQELSPIANNMHILAMLQKCELHVMAYGNPCVNFREQTLKPTDKWHYLKLTKSGNPCHPLYLKRDLKPIKF